MEDTVFSQPLSPGKRVGMPFLTLTDRLEIPANGGRMWKVASVGENVGVFLATLSPGAAHRLHRHPNHAELVLVTAGRIDQTIERYGTRRLIAGEAAFIAPGVRHAVQPLDPDTTVVLVLVGDGHQYEAVEDSADPAPSRPVQVHES